LTRELNLIQSNKNGEKGTHLNDFAGIWMKAILQKDKIVQSPDYSGELSEESLRKTDAPISGALVEIGRKWKSGIRG
jgi:hypothetical protein